MSIANSQCNVFIVIINKDGMQGSTWWRWYFWKCTAWELKYATCLRKWLKEVAQCPEK